MSENISKVGERIATAQEAGRWERSTARKLTSDDEALKRKFEEALGPWAHSI